MEKGYSVSTELPPGYSPDYDFYIFSKQSHLALQSDEWLTFYLLRKPNQKVMAQVAFHISDHTALSPVRAPFGSFLFSEKLSPSDLYEFVQQLEIRLKKLNVRVVSIVEPPLYYRKAGELLQTIFINLGYRISLAELSTGIRIDRISFDEKIEVWERRKLKQAKEKGAHSKMLPLEELENVYNLIKKCKDQRGYQLSMSLTELQATVNAFKKDFILSGVFHNKELIAASIAIRVRADILYNFYSGHLKKFDSISPVVTLIRGLYRYCEQNNYKLLDLGTSTLHGQPNFSLLEFKLRLGAVPSMKLTFEKQL